METKPIPGNPSSQFCFSTGHGIICAGLPRSGTASLAVALNILALGPVHHGLNIQDKREMYEWGRAAWCNLPYLCNSRSRLPFYINRYDSLLPWTRSNWDRLIGQHRVSTDFGSLFCKHLIRAYPEARVILVERDVDEWTHSLGSIFIDNWLFGLRGLILCGLGPWVGVPGPNVIRDLLMGYLQVGTKHEAWAKLPVAHKEHYMMVREMVPPEQLLEFNLDDGWEPLCRFLGVPIPDLPFPHHNKRESIMERRKKRSHLILLRACKWLGSSVLLLGLGVVLGINILGWTRS